MMKVLDRVCDWWVLSHHQDSVNTRSYAEYCAA